MSSRGVKFAELTLKLILTLELILESIRLVQETSVPKGSANAESLFML